MTPEFVPHDGHGFRGQAVAGPVKRELRQRDHGPPDLALERVLFLERMSGHASRAVALRMHTVSWLVICGSGPWLQPGMQPSAIVHLLRTRVLTSALYDSPARPSVAAG